MHNACSRRAVQLTRFISSTPVWEASWAAETASCSPSQQCAPSLVCWPATGGPGWEKGNRPMQHNHSACRLHLFSSTRRPGPLSDRAAGRMQVSPRISGEKPGQLRFPSFFSLLARGRRPESRFNVPVPARRLPVPPREVEKLAIGRQRRDQAIDGLGPQLVGGPLLGCGAPEWALSKLSFDCLPTSSQYSLTKK